MKKFLKNTLVILLVIALMPLSALQSVFAAVNEKVDFEEAKNSAVVMYVNKSNVLINGSKSYIPDNNVPYKYGEDIYIPVEFFASTIGGTVSATETTATVSTESRNVTVSILKNSKGTAYANVEDLCFGFEYYLSVQDNGLFAYSQKNLDELFDWTSNLYEIREMLESFLFDDVSGEELYNRLITNNNGNQHPRLLIDETQMQMIRDEVAAENGDEIYKNLADEIITDANTYLTTDVSEYELRDDLRLLYVAWEVSDIIIGSSLAYRLTGDERYAQRAYDEMAAVCAFPDWNPKHYLDVGVMSAAVAIGYDWIYNWMTPEQRATVREGIETHVIPTVLEDMNGCVGERTYQWYREGNVNNWRCVCAGGVGVAMLSMMDEFEGETLAQAKEILPAMLEAIRPTMMLFAPSGAYEEGFGYWEFAMQNFSYFIKSLEMTTGSDYGYVDLPGMNMATDYFVAANGPVQIFNYHNVGATYEVFYPAQLLYLADKFDNQGNIQPVLDRILSNTKSAYGEYDDIIYYNPEMSEVSDETQKLDAYFAVSEIATMRTSLNDANATFVGLHADRPFGNGAADKHHMDAGQFQLQAKGEVWFIDLGSNGYNVSDIHNTYRFRAEGHNTVIFNPDADFAMKEYGDVYISDFYSGNNLSYAVAQMTDAYNEEEGVNSFLRGVRLDREKGYVTIQDEIDLDGSADMYWFAHTTANITISDDGKVATLVKNGKQIKAYIVNGDAATFSVMDAAPLPTSPQVPDQDAIADNVKKLTIHIDECEDIDLCVVFATSELSIEEYEYSSISDWEKADCRYTAHTVDPIYYKGTNDDGTISYYHSCIYCGEKGITTFEVKDNNVVYNKKVKSVAAEIVPTTCVTDGTYVYSCICGTPDSNRANVYTETAKGHDSNSLKCVIGTGDMEGKHWQVCKNCDNNNTTVSPNGIIPAAHTLSHAIEDAYLVKHIDNTNGTKTYTVNGYKAATSNGYVGSGEYSTTAKLSIAGHSNNLKFETLMAEADAAKVSESVSISFAHDANKIYIGITDKSGTGIERGAYGLRLGFDEDHPENFVGIFMQCVDVSADGTSPRTNVHNALVTRSGDTDSYNYSQAGFRGILRSNGTGINWPYVRSDNGGYTVLHYTTDTKSIYPVTAMTIAKEAVSGNISSQGTTGNGRISSGQHYAYVEIELDKELLLDYFNEMYADGEGIENLDTMLFNYIQCESSSTSSSNAQSPFTMWGGNFTSDAATATNAMTAYNFDKVVFSEDLNEDLLDEDGAVQYYHACNYCGYIYDIPAYRVKDGSVIYDNEIQNELTAVDSMTYVYSCTCGTPDPDRTNIYKVAPDGHDAYSLRWVVGTGDMAGKHWLVCDDCDNNSTTECPEGITPTAHTLGHSIDDEYLVKEVQNTNGTKTYTVDGYKKATPTDATIGSNEYTTTAKLSIAGHSNNLKFETLMAEADATKVSESVSISFAHDANKIYIGITDKSGTGIERGAYGLRLGFDEEHPENFVGIFMQCVDVSADGTSSRTNVHNALVTSTGDTDSYKYSQAGWRGILRSNGTGINWPYVRSDNGGYTVLKYTADTKSIYPVTAMTVSKEAVSGNISSQGTTGHGRISSGQHYAYVEIELDKELLLDYFNEMYADGEGIENLDTMLFNYIQCESSSTSNSNAQSPFTMWGGNFTSDAATATNAMTAYNFDKVVFSEDLNEDLLDEDGAVQYYHACNYCGYIYDIPAYRVKDGSVIYDNEIQNELTAVDCMTYVYSCTCGTPDPDRTNTYTISLEGRGQVYFGQDTYYSNAKVSDTDIGMDNGINKDRWKILESTFDCVTSEVIKPTITSGAFSGKSQDGSITTITNSEYAPVTPDYRYYAAKSDNKVYLAFDMLYNPGTTTVGVTNVMTSNYYEYYRIGFNPDDPTQQLVIAIKSNGLPTSGHESIVAIADADTYEILENKIYNRDAKYYEYVVTTTSTTSESRVRKFAFTIDTIIALWEEQFGVTLTEEDFNSVYVVISNKYGSSAKIDGETKEWYATYGTVIDADTAQTLGTTNLLPDTIVFGTEPPASKTCNYTAHNTDDLYYAGKDAEGNNLYYHSCPLCGDAKNAKTFKVDSDGEVIYNQKIVSEAAEVAPATCVDGGTYVYSCTCGTLDPDRTNTYTILLEGRDQVYFGQDTYYSDAKVSDTDIGMDNGLNKDRWKILESAFDCVTSEVIKPTITSGAFSGKSQDGSITTITNSEYAPVTPDYRYYAAKSDNKVYLAFDMLYNPGTTTVGVTNVMTSNYYEYYRIGFNPDDPTQQLVIAIKGHGIPTSGQEAIVAIADASKYTVLENNILNKDAKYYEYVVTTTSTSSESRVRKFAFTIDTIIALWEEQFGVTLTEEDFNSVYVVISNKYGSSAKIDGETKEWYATYGTVIDADTAQTLGTTNLLPDTIVFGTEPPASKTCNYTAHNTDDLYYAGKDAEGNNLYYHSCPLCGDAVNAKTFSEKTWTAATCTEPKICTICGESEGDVLDHNFTGAWSSDADGHWHVCANEGCNETDTKADHISSGDATEDAAEVCTECGYEIAPKLNHVHNYTVLNNDETNHWYECACGVADEATRVVHTGTDDNNCETEVKCSACNYVVVAAKTHDYTGAWSSDAEGHWHVCANDGCNVADTKIGHTDIEDDNDCTTAVKCSACEFVVIEAKAHDFDDATCTAPKTCTVCGTTEGEALDHDWDEGNVTTVASCTVPGVKTYTCKNDATHTYTEDLGIDENAHVYDDGFVTTNPTCMTAGEKTYTCLLNSEHKKYEPVDIDDDAHNFNTETLANDATGHWYACANEGCEVKNEFNAHISSGAATEETAEVCTVCGFEIAPKLDHVHNYNVLDKDATDHWYKCACGVADEATREAHAGTDDNNCATAVNCTCGYEITAAKSHDYTGEWVKDAEGHAHKCANEGCNETDTKVGHISGGAATEEAAEVCTVCGYEITPALEHSHNYTVLDKDETEHWYKCSCGAVDEGTRTAHTGTDDNNCESEVVCNVCGYTITASKTHDYTGAWNSDANGHWHVCANAGCTVTETKADHVYDNDADATCNDCGFEREVSGGDIGGGDDVGGGATGSNSQTITSIGGSVSIEVTATYKEGGTEIDETPIYSVIITWDDMTFEYNTATAEYVWNPDTLEYDEVESSNPGGWTEHQAKIYIENRSNAAVIVTAIWQPAEGVNASPVISKDSVKLDSAVGCVGTGKTAEIIVSNPTSGSITGSCTLGTIVLEIKADTSAE